jgi:hypothetical protein
MTRLPRASISLAIVLLTATSALAQPMLFPPGPPTAPSGRMGVRTQITTLPYVIATPGSYYLSTNLTQSVPGDGISISSDNVTLDLMGFTLAGAGFAGSNAIGLAPGAFSNITIRNGYVTAWGADGIALGGATRVTVENVVAVSNVGVGIAVGMQSTVRDCTAALNGATGITLASDCKLRNSTSCSNSANGVLVGPDCHLSNVVANDNTGDGIGLGPSSTLVASVTSGNGNNGVMFTMSVRITDCTSGFNGFMTGTGDGFFAPGPPGGSILGGCTAFNNAEHGYSAGPGPIGGNAGASVHDSFASFNGFITGGGDGFNNFRAVVQCTSNNNSGDGIETAAGGHVYRSTCESNGANGILATADGNVIEQNNVAFNTLAGIMTVVPGNMVAANRSHLNAPPYALAVGTTAWAIIGPGPLAAPANANSNVIY